MTPSQAKAKARREVNRFVEEREEEEIENAELNLVPYLDIITNTLMFLLATISMALPMVNLNVTQPPIAPPGSASMANPEQDATKKLNLTVSVSHDGFWLFASQGKEEIAMKPDGTLDYDKLRARAAELKRQFPQEMKFNLTADRDMPYTDLTATMDAMRGTATATSAGDLFPDVAIVPWIK